MRHTLHIAYDPVYAHPLPVGHRFPMQKYELLPVLLIREGTIREEHLFSPVPCPEDVVCLTHTPDYYQRLTRLELSAKDQREIGFPQSEALVHRERVITQGTIDCCSYARQHGVALNVAGGTHHAFAGRGEGFCLLNDFGVAANFLLREKLSDKVLIVDLDVHQGNGTASLFSNEPRVFTFSMHGAHNYPFRKETSDLDIALADGTGDAEYLGLLEKNLSRLIRDERPDMLFFLSGVDILETDKFGKLKLTMRGCYQRDELVFAMAKQAGIPCVVAMGGGYSPDVMTIVEAHGQTFRLARQTWDLD